MIGITLGHRPVTERLTSTSIRAIAVMVRKATVAVVVNGHVVQTLPSYTNSATIYRCANPSGYYHLAVVSFPASHLKTGANSVTFDATHVDDSGGKCFGVCSK